MRPADRLLLRLLGTVRRRLLLQTAAAVATNLGAVGLALLAGEATGRLAGSSGGAGDGAPQGLWWLALAIAGVGLAEYLTASVQALQGARASVEVFVAVRRRLVTVAHRDGEQLPDAGEQRLLALGTTDSENVDVLVMLAGQLVGAVAGVVATAVAAARIEPWLAVGVLVAALLAGTVVARLGNWALDLAVGRNAATQRVTGFLSTAVDARDTVAGLALRPALLDHSRRISQDARDAGLQHARAVAAGTAAGRVVGVAALAAVGILLALPVTGGGLDPADAVTAVALVGALVPVLARLALGLGQLSAARAGAARLADLLTRPPLAADDGTDSADDADDAQGAQSRHAGWVQLRQVTVAARHPGAAPLLDRVDLDLAAGELVGICGPSRAGKSLLLAVIRGAVRPDQGTARVGDRDPWLLPATARPGVVATGEQRPFLYDDTLADNLALAGTGPVALAEALRLAVADGLPDEIGERRLGPRGSGVSGGQRRRLTVARALATPAGVVTLDDPTASLDPVTEAALARRLRDRRDGRTVLLASNRATVLRECDRVLLLVEGRVAAVGRHQDLLTDPRYQDLVSATLRDDGEAG